MQTRKELVQLVIDNLGITQSINNVVIEGTDSPWLEKALIKRKKDEEAGQAHYGALNRAAMQLLAQDGFLISCSCSHHLSAESLQRILLREARACARKLQLLEQGAQGPDHPVHPAIPETRYLKAWYCRATAG